MLTDSLGENAATSWFGAGFGQLHPQLQSLHRGSGGRLQGTVNLRLGKGLAGVAGRRLAHRLGLPLSPGVHEFSVDIVHDADGMQWLRCFDGVFAMTSHFRPVGAWPEGYWLEHTGALEMRLGVDVVDGDWHWTVRGTRLRGVPLPRGLLPQLTAHKRIRDGKYDFFVGVALPGLGQVLSYSGQLDQVRA
jgi:hypothetical protein